MVEMLKTVTETGLPVWEGYQLGDGAVVLHPGQSDEGKACLGIWLHGKAMGFTESIAAPKLLTPLYGYHLNYDGLKSEDDYGLLKASLQPEEIRQWLDQLEVGSAVLMPTDFPNFPIKISTLKKVQLAIHEAFHVEVQLRYWYTQKGSWPVWDVQPDRKGLQACYNSNEEVKTAVRAEQMILSELIEALLTDKKDQICQFGQQFLTKRASRYKMLKEVSVTRKDGTNCDCNEAETIMELEEGIADYASWTKLFELGISSKEELLQRYRAVQNEPFYLMGAMQLHAISLMRDGDVDDIIKTIVRSESPQNGALTTLFKAELGRFCQ